MAVPRPVLKTGQIASSIIHSPPVVCVWVAVGFSKHSVYGQYLSRIFMALIVNTAIADLI